MALVERNGKGYSKRSKNVDGKTLKGNIKRMVNENSTNITDEWKSDIGIGKDFSLCL
jgi:hypothetical protein